MRILNANSFVSKKNFNETIVFKIIELRTTYGKREVNRHRHRNRHRWRIRHHFPQPCCFRLHLHPQTPIVHVNQEYHEPHEHRV